MGNWLRACNIPLLLGVMALAVILAGGFVRINDAGESCPDWPTCFGTLGFDASEEDQTAWYEANPDEIDSRGENHRYTTFEIFTEWFHRFLATGSGAVVLFGLFKVYKKREKLSDENWFAAKAALVIVLAQGGLGAITVWFDNESWSVVLHLIFALIYTIWLFYWWLIWLRDVDEFPKWATLSKTISSEEKKTFGMFTLGSLPVLLLGVWIATGGGGSFNTGCSVGWWQGWPLCQGSVIPDIMGNIAVFVAWIHRIAVLVVGIWLTKGYFDLKNRLNGEAKNLQLSFGIALLVFMINILVGASYVILAAGDGFPELLSLAHLSFGTDVVLLLGIGYTICHLNE